MTYRQEQERAGREARNALPPVVRDFYEERFRYQYDPGSDEPPWTFLGLRCRVCGRMTTGPHRSSCPVPKAERALKKVTELRRAKEDSTDA